MFIIAGLGNPSREYDKTRHNAGFDTVDYLAEKHGISISEKKHKALVGKGIIAGEKVILIKPQTFMNLSGESIRAVLDFYKADEREELIVVYDDISLPPGQLRIRKKGSAGGHNGIKNIIAHLGHDTFMRVKVGVGEKPQGYDLADYVLGRFSKEDRAVMEEAFKEAADAIEVMITEGPDAAMNLYNKKK
ncbi:MAG: aminoacyl-tRNA hydrolase [Lachnospiraceae bacterium]|nr:aminoacyl-tRNA hydrolase [Lachnospiraceae bacterium]